MENYYDMNGFRVHFRIADYASNPMVMAITAEAEDDEFDMVLTVNIGSSIESEKLYEVLYELEV